MYRLKYLRESELLTQKQVAEKIACGQRAYAYYEEALRDIPTKVLISLCELYDVSADFLLGRTAQSKLSGVRQTEPFRFKELRQHHGYNQSQVAKAIFVTQNAYSYYENRKRDIPTATLIRLADFYDVSVDYILGRTDEPKMNK